MIINAIELKNKNRLYFCVTACIFGTLPENCNFFNCSLLFKANKNNTAGINNKENSNGKCIAK